MRVYGSVNSSIAGHSYKRKMTLSSNRQQNILCIGHEMKIRLSLSPWHKLPQQNHSHNTNTDTLSYHDCHNPYRRHYPHNPTDKESNDNLRFGRRICQGLSLTATWSIVAMCRERRCSAGGRWPLRSLKWVRDDMVSGQLGGWNWKLFCKQGIAYQPVSACRPARSRLLTWWGWRERKDVSVFYQHKFVAPQWLFVLACLGYVENDGRRQPSCGELDTRTIKTRVFLRLCACGYLATDFSRWTFRRWQTWRLFNRACGSDRILWIVIPM